MAYIEFVSNKNSQLRIYDDDIFKHAHDWKHCVIEIGSIGSYIIK